jgi:hypothetical protein
MLRRTFYLSVKSEVLGLLNNYYKNWTYLYILGMFIFALILKGPEGL